MEHLTVRVAWHDSGWRGTVCQAPSANAYCVALARVREERDDAYEDGVAGTAFAQLKGRLPPCALESGAFMSARPWRRTFTHPYQEIPKAQSTHGHLQPLVIDVPEFTTFAVPFAWMLRENQERIQDGLAEQLPPDRDPPFDTAWVFGRERQEALLARFFDAGLLVQGSSMVMFYTKHGHPLGDDIPRLIVGVGELTSIRELRRYPTAELKATYPLWDRMISHSIRTDGAKGFLLPYHEYLRPTGDADEDARRRELLDEVVVRPDDDQIVHFSYHTEHAGSDIALGVLVKLLEATRRIRAHGIAAGEWLAREEWVNEQIASTWRDRGPFPGLGSALEAVGLRLGTALVLDLRAKGQLRDGANPWPLVDALIRGDREPPRLDYVADLRAVRNTWINIGHKRRRLLELLSRFSLTPPQARRWYETRLRDDVSIRSLDDSDLLADPYVIAEADLGDATSPPVSLTTVDRGAFPDSAIRTNHPLPADEPVESPIDVRRVRAALVTVLRRAHERGDTLLAVDDILERVEALPLSPKLEVPQDWLVGNASSISSVVAMIDVIGKSGERFAACQLRDVGDREDRLSRILRKRAQIPLASLGADWKGLLREAIEGTGGHVDPADARHGRALSEQSAALERITTRKASVLVGRAGTGKTSALGALNRCKPLQEDGILFLAPTGKARVRLGRATGAQAQTVAQFLHGCGRYDGPRQRPLQVGANQYRAQRTVVIDEASMLTLDDLSAVVNALDLTHVQRLILVGDPNQLPPIGPGRPFVDFVAHLQAQLDVQDDGAALGRLDEEVRSAEGEPSAALQLASWFTSEPQGPGADAVLHALVTGAKLNDIEVAYWESVDELRDRLLDELRVQLDLAGPRDVAGFNAALGLDARGLVPWDSPDSVERFQILSPVRMRQFGAVEINRWIQRIFRAAELANAQRPWVPSLGDENIVVRDKVIQIRNGNRIAYDGSEKRREFLANGEVGLVGPGKDKWLNVHFAHRPNLTFGYRNSTDFPGGTGPLELAYALTVHKAQGSDFELALVVIPADLPFVSRELVYTALTRSRDRLVLLIQGSDASSLLELGRPERSDTTSRNTNMFGPVVRAYHQKMPYAEHLIHTTDQGHLVRSKSELVIANKLWQMKIAYEYERPYRGEVVKGLALPDFTFQTLDGSVILWEHLGMLDKPRYRSDWEHKLRWYLENGLEEGVSLFTTREDGGRGLQTKEIETIAEYIRREIS